MNIAQLYEQVKNMSDGQLADLMQQNDPHKSSMALGEINYRNERRAAEAMQMDKPPTVAEQQLAEAGISAGGMPNAEAISPMAANGIGALPDQMAPFARNNTGILRAETPMTMTAAGGGLVALAEGGQVIPFQNEGLVAPEEEFDTLGFLGDQTYFGEDGFIFDTTNPVDYAIAGAGTIPALGTIGAGAKGLYNLATKAPKLYKKYKKARDKFDKKVAEKFQKRSDTSIELDPIPRFGKYNPLSRYAKPGALRKDVGRSAGLGTLGYFGGSIANAPEGQTPPKSPELMGPPKPSAALMASNEKLIKAREELKAAQDAAAKADENVVPKSKAKGILSTLATAPELAGMIAGFVTAEDGASKGIQAGAKFLQAQQGQELKREELEDLKEYRDTVTNLKEKQIDRVYDAAVKKSRLDVKDLGKLRIDFNKQNEAGIAREAKDNLDRAKAKTGFLGFGQVDITGTMLQEEIERLEKKKFKQFIAQLYGGTSQLDMLSLLDDEIYSRAETPVAGIGVGS